MLRGEGGAVWPLDLPLSEPHAERVAAGTLIPADDRSRRILAGDEPDERSAPAPTEAPPKAGPGSGREAWAAHARGLGIEVTDDMDRAGIIAAVEAAG
ncbi:MAG: hypothetical protein RIB67_07510 [Miltoncostaeaceae bacterium]